MRWGRRGRPVDLLRYPTPTPTPATAIAHAAGTQARETGTPTAASPSTMPAPGWSRGLISSQISQAMALLSWRWLCEHHRPSSWAPSLAYLAHTEVSTLRPNLRAPRSCSLPAPCGPASPGNIPVPQSPRSGSGPRCCSSGQSLACRALRIFLLEREVTSL